MGDCAIGNSDGICFKDPVRVETVQQQILFAGFADEPYLIGFAVVVFDDDAGILKNGGL